MHVPAPQHSSVQVPWVPAVAAIGTVVGAGAGTAVQVMTKGEQVHVPSETLLEFVLQQEVRVPVA